MNTSARDSALEEAARVCDEHARLYSENRIRANTAQGLAAAIRSLKSQPAAPAATESAPRTATEATLSSEKPVDPVTQATTDHAIQIAGLETDLRDYRLALQEATRDRDEKAKLLLDAAVKSRDEFHARRRVEAELRALESKVWALLPRDDDE